MKISDRTIERFLAHKETVNEEKIVELKSEAKTEGKTLQEIVVTNEFFSDEELTRL